jgi:chorismate synthase
MKNTFGTAITITLFGESHGTAIGAVLDGIAPGIKISEAYIEEKLLKRKAKGNISTKRQEADNFEILSGVFNGYTTGTPLCIIIRNEKAKSEDYEHDKDSRLARPSHADYSAYCKYSGFEDYRGGGHFSGRITAALVAACAILSKALEDKGIYVATHIKNCHGIWDRDFKDHMYDIRLLNNLAFPVLDATISAKMKQEISNASAEGDSVGGILETAIIGVPAGVGEPWFDNFESHLAHGIFSIPAVKGIQFGAGFRMAEMKGSEANDSFRYEDDKLVTTTNNNGGINGGITNGMPIIFSTAIKPTSSIFKTQDTIDLYKKENAQLTLKGRHDPAILHRAAVVIDAMAVFTVCDLLTIKFGTDFLKC